MSLAMETAILDRRRQSTEINTSAGQSVKLTLLNPEDEGSGDLEVSASGRTSLLKAFCGRSNWDETQKCFPAQISFLVLTSASTAILLGLTRVCVVNGTGNVREALQLFRSPDDDRGFYRPFTIVEHPEFIVILYESGVFALMPDGVVVWHTRLAYDDAIVETRKDELIICNEHVRDGRSWRLRLIDGSILD
jgi:hypothetical protein